MEKRENSMAEAAQPSENHEYEKELTELAEFLYSVYKKRKAQN